MNRIAGVILLFLSAMYSIAQNSPVRFQSITINDGLSLSSVYCIEKDSKGFMWFGTEDGLNRFDGYHFRIFRTDVNNPNSICYKWIEHIEEDGAGNLWFGSRNGLSCYNPRNEHFTNFKSHLPHALSNDTVTSLLSYKQWMLAGTKDGLNVIHTRQFRNKQFANIVKVNDIIDYQTGCYIAASSGLYRFTANADTALLEQIDSDLFVDFTRAGHSLYGFTAKAVYRMDSQGHKHVMGYPFQNRYPDEQIQNGVVDYQGRIWLSTNNGLFVHHVKKRWTKQIVRTQNSTNSLAVNTNKSLHLDQKGTIWFATHGDGLFLVNSQLQVTKCVHNPTDNESISQNAFNCIFSDMQDGNIWLGTYGAGINVYHEGANKFDLIKHNPLDANSLPSNFLWSVFEARDSCLWIGTNDKGLSRYCPASDTYLTYLHQANRPQSLSNNSVRKVYEDSDGVIWVGTDGGGLNRFDAHSQSFTSFQKSEQNTHSLSDNSVRVIFEDKHKRLWIGTRNGLNLMDRSTGTFKQYLHNPNDSTSLSNNFVYASIIEDSKGYIWIGTYGGGLNQLHPQTELFKHYTTSGQADKRLSNDIVFCVYEDDEEMIWIGTNEGLNVLNPSTGIIKIYGTNIGLPNEVIYGILPDYAGNLWLSTNNGISCVNPRTMKCRNYDVSDGLQSNEFNGGAFHRGRTGKLYFGGVYGLNILNPQMLKENMHVNQPLITSLEVLGNEVSVSTNQSVHKGFVTEVDSQFVIASNISYTRHVSLDYSQRFFAIEYSGLNHLFPHKTQYAFQLLPLDKKWNKAGTRNYVSYSNLKPGDYLFRVKSTNNDGVWSNSAAELQLTIRPPFWFTNWFVGLEIILFVVLVVFVHRYLLKIKTNKLLRYQNTQIKLANAQLQQSEDNLKEINATKDKFFSIISHDLKNPFTSLLSITELLSANYDAADEADRKNGIQRIYSSVKQIHNLLENLLTWSRSQQGKITFQFKPFDLSALITENMNLYRHAAQRKKLTLTNAVSESFQGLADRNTINTIIRNLTGNAVKFTRKGGEITFSIADADSFWKVLVKDNGVGIKAEDQAHLFSIDKKRKTEGTSGEKGTGLGLIICKEFAEKNGGQIGVLSKPGQGTEFWFLVKKAY